MKRLLRKEIEDPLSMELLSNAGKDFNTVAIECNSGKIKVKLEKVEGKESHCEELCDEAIRNNRLLRTSSPQ